MISQQHNGIKNRDNYDQCPQCNEWKYDKSFTKIASQEFCTSCYKKLKKEFNKIPWVDRQGVALKDFLESKRVMKELTT